MSGIEKIKIEQALKVTRKMYENPAFALFRDPVDPATPGYYQSIKNPQDISSILGRLEKGQYLSFEKWRDDVKQIFTNCRKFNDQFEDLVDYANQCQAIFEKYMKELPPLTMSLMSTEMLSQIDKLQKLFKNPPKAIKEILPKDNKYTHDQLNMQDSDKSKLLERINNFSSPDDILRVTHIMEYFKIPKNSEHNGIINYSADKLTDEVYWNLGATFPK
ncbi:Bromodomain containing protein [Trichomonas vaginalis G3]|uniref:Bromodomain containing protein n=1 Tax=Trichomonas vaginalis (strain ATCC PRA-98 / G3) TaxID=412133 RepID=A2D8L3_TRIV3|nr:acetylation-dependent protein binding [Trichomonas vaginalis G3]EAY23262.1 Bromodomain containing protein [Trichomonas vaginalis G3]KAI5534089.1 acetylation-dependent protein binding [Trichomonas vaginalis G3]|eukprot:XP_001584248.1 Bromodomain containing protein [Trichomonas vaginalis G3]